MSIEQLAVKLVNLASKPGEAVCIFRKGVVISKNYKDKKGVDSSRSEHVASGLSPWTTCTVTPLRKGVMPSELNSEVMNKVLGPKFSGNKRNRNRKEKIG